MLIGVSCSNFIGNRNEHAFMIYSKRSGYNLYNVNLVCVALFCDLNIMHKGLSFLMSQCIREWELSAACISSGDDNFCHDW